MKFPFFASSIVFIIWLTYQLKKYEHIDKKAQDRFWDKENKANSVRKKSLVNLSYVRIPIETLPMDLLPENEIMMDIYKTITLLKDKKIVNFTGYSNTDLKLKYGAPNITSLTEYDQNYTLLVRTLQKWAELLYKNNYVDACKSVLEFAISTRTDVSKTYKLLADIYFSEGNFDGIRSLYDTALTLNSVMKNAIVRTLKESYLYND